MPALLLTAHQSACRCHAPFYPYSWTRPWNTPSLGAATHYQPILPLLGEQSTVSPIVSDVPDEPAQVHCLIKPTKPGHLQRGSLVSSPPRSSFRSGAQVSLVLGEVLHLLVCRFMWGSWITLSLTPPLRDPTRSYRPWQHSSNGHRITQTPPLW